MSKAVIGLLGACWLAGCGSECTAGAAEACACMGGLTGVQTCGAEGTLGPCDCGQLSEGEAAQLVRSQRDFTHGIECSIQVSEFAHERYGLALAGGCVDSLARAGFIRRAGCVRDYGSAYCPEEEIVPIGQARVDGIDLKLPCGEISLISIVSIATDGTEAAFTYEREVILDESVVGSVSACQLRVAEAGRAVRQRRARRDDAGRWALVSGR